jgi:hypothetical protein
LSDHGTVPPATRNIITIINQYELRGLKPYVCGTTFWDEWLQTFHMIMLASLSNVISPRRTDNTGAWGQDIGVVVTVLAARRVQVCCSGSEEQQC